MNNLITINMLSSLPTLENQAIVNKQISELLPAYTIPTLIKPFISTSLVHSIHYWVGSSEALSQKELEVTTLFPTIIKCRPKFCFPSW